MPESIDYMRSGLILHELMDKYEVMAELPKEPQSIIQHAAQVTLEIFTRRLYAPGQGTMFRPIIACKPDTDSLPKFCIKLYHPSKGLVLCTVYKPENSTLRVIRPLKKRGRKKK